MLSAARAVPGTQPSCISFRLMTKLTLPKSPKETDGLSHPPHLPGPSISTATVEGSGNRKQLLYQGLRLTQMQVAWQHLEFAKGVENQLLKSNRWSQTI